MTTNLTENQLLDIYGFVFSTTHSNGFKTSEIKDLLFNKDYWFLETPKEGWYRDVLKYLIAIGFNTSNLNINPKYSNLKNTP